MPPAPALLRTLATVALGALAFSPVAAGLGGLHLAAGGEALDPAALALLAWPVLGGALAATARHLARAWGAERAQAGEDLRTLEDRRRRLADEVAQLHGLELSLLTDLEDAEAELESQRTVVGSLVRALRSTLEDLDRTLPREPSEADAARLDGVASQVAAVLDLVVDVQAFVGEADPSDAVLPEVPDGARVLLGADTPPARARLRRLLESWGLEVTVARTGAETVALAEAEAVDLVVLDLHDDTLVTLETLRSHPALVDLPALVVSPDLGNLVWLRPPGDVALTRPTSQDQLSDHVVDALRHRTPQPGAQRRRRVLALAPCPSFAGALVRAGASLGTEVVTVASVDALVDADGPWDLALLDAEVDDETLADAAASLAPEVPRLLVSARITGTDRTRARGLGLTDATVRPTDGPSLARLLALAGAGRPAASRLGARG